MKTGECRSPAYSQPAVTGRIAPTHAAARLLTTISEQSTVIWQLSAEATTGCGEEIQKVRGRQTVLMSREGLPRCLRTALRRRSDAVVLEDRFNRVPGNVVTEVVEPTADARLAPRRVLGRQACDERGEIRLGARPTRPALRRAVVILRDQQAVPAQIVSSVTMPATSPRRRRPRTLPFRASRRRWSSVRRTRWGPYAARRIRFSSPQVLDDVLLLTIDPAGEQQEQEGERGRQPIHWRQCTQVRIEFQSRGDRSPHRAG